jgi:GNAT superfamily N-acetyltransferase
MVEIRPIAEADIDVVAALHVRTWQAGYAGIVPAEVLDALDPAAFAERRRTRPAPAGAQTLVATERGTIVGFASFGRYRLKPADEDDPAAGELYAIYVDPGHWGGGTGRALLARAKAELAAAGYTEMRLWVLTDNDRGRRFYDRAGLAPDGAHQTYTPRGSTTELPEVRYATRL